MATGGNAPGELTGSQIVNLATHMTRENMELFAEGYLGIDSIAQSHLSDGTIGNPITFNRRVLNCWKDKSRNHDAKHLADLLYAATVEHPGLADPHKVGEILGVPRSVSHTVSGLKPKRKQAAPKKKEFQDLADDLRPHTERAMKIEVAPWVQDYVVDMDDLYCELSLEKLENKPLGEQNIKLDSYIDLYETSGDDRTCVCVNVSQNVAKHKVLMKADPGMGKTTLGKRIAYDWARGVFTKVSLVLFVFLKFVKPGDAIENVIIDQNPVLEGMGVTADRLEAILGTFGSRCLLILDGMDEHAQGSNSDIIKIIHGRKLLHCNLILTSRPHSTKKYEKEFDTIVRVDGFTESEAKKFAMKLLEDGTIVENVLKFNPSANETPLYRCPILLAFLCILVREEGAGSIDKDITKGEIYAKMMKCLYKKFTIRKGKQFKDKEFVDALIGVGKLAYQTLLSGDPLMKRSQVVREVGEDVFDFGLLIGNEDHRIVGTRDADIFITFPHRSLQEFLGSFYYIWMLSEGHSVESLVGSGKEPFFMKNPLFMEFCVWFLYNSEFEPFVLPERDTVLSAMSGYVAGRIDKRKLDLSEKYSLVSSILDLNDLNLSHAWTHGNKQMIRFYESVLEKLPKTKEVVIPDHIPVDWVIQHLKESSREIRRLTLSSAKRDSTEQNLEFVRLQSDISYEHIYEDIEPEMVKKSDRIQTDPVAMMTAIDQNKLPNLREADVYVTRYFEFSKFDECPAEHLERIKLSCPASCQVIDILKRWRFREIKIGENNKFEEHDLSAIEQFFDEDLPFVEELSLYDSEVVGKVANAKLKGRLPNLNILRLYRAYNLSALFSQAWPGLVELNLSECYLNPKDLTSLARAKSEEKLPDLKVLGLRKNNDARLDLEGCYLKPLDRMSLARAKSDEKLPDLKDLHLRHSGKTFGNLSALFSHVWPGLEKLHLSDRVLKSENIKDLARAKAQGKLPDLKVLNIRYNALEDHSVPDLLHTDPDTGNSISWGTTVRYGYMPKVEL